MREEGFGTAIATDAAHTPCRKCCLIWKARRVYRPGAGGAFPGRQGREGRGEDGCRERWWVFWVGEGWWRGAVRGGSGWGRAHGVGYARRACAGRWRCEGLVYRCWRATGGRGGGRCVASSRGGGARSPTSESEVDIVEREPERVLASRLHGDARGRVRGLRDASASYYWSGTHRCALEAKTRVARRIERQCAYVLGRAGRDSISIGVPVSPSLQPSSGSRPKFRNPARAEPGSDRRDLSYLPVHPSQLSPQMTH